MKQRLHPGSQRPHRQRLLPQRPQQRQLMEVLAIMVVAVAEVLVAAVGRATTIWGGARATARDNNEAEADVPTAEIFIVRPAGCLPNRPHNENFWSLRA